MSRPPPRPVGPEPVNPPTLLRRKALPVRVIVPPAWIIAPPPEPPPARPPALLLSVTWLRLNLTVPGLLLALISTAPPSCCPVLNEKTLSVTTTLAAPDAV